jgi:hypothetical protein
MPCLREGVRPQEPQRPSTSARVERQARPTPDSPLTSRAIHVFLRQAGERNLTSVQKDGAEWNEETSSTWQMERGLALASPLER